MPPGIVGAQRSYPIAVDVADVRHLLTMDQLDLQWLLVAILYVNLKLLIYFFSNFVFLYLF